MDETFWDSIKRLLGKMDQPDIWLIRNADLGKTAITNGQRKKTSPSVDIAYRCAKVLGTTVEELVDGEAGAEYVRKIVRNDPRAIQVPDRLSSIVEDLFLLEEKELIGIRANVEALAEAKKGQSTGTEGLVG
jgi:transcriptional regulator with XRE-family HTH domain